MKSSGKAKGSEADIKESNGSKIIETIGVTVTLLVLFAVIALMVYGFYYYVGSEWLQDARERGKISEPDPSGPQPETGLGQATGKFYRYGSPTLGHTMYIVRVHGSKFELAHTAVTDSAGKWFINNVTPGRYTVYFVKPRGKMYVKSGIFEVKPGKKTNFGKYDPSP